MSVTGGSGEVDDRVSTLRALAQAAFEPDQQRLRAQLSAPMSPDEIRNVYLANPFLRLTDLELGQLRSASEDGSVAGLVALREAAIRRGTPGVAVFCMPKSGSSFVQSALQVALDVPLVSLTTFTSPRQSTFFGMNAREQELDELAMISAALGNPGGYVAQHHTRCTPFLALQLQTFGIRPVVTVRSLFDIIISFDDMLMNGPMPGGRYPWVKDAQFALPTGFRTRPAAERYEILCAGLGPWLVGFFLSWKRCEAAGLVQPIRLTYEVETLDQDAMVAKLSDSLRLAPVQRQRLTEYVARPDRARSRFNRGGAGRGRRLLPEHLQAWLLQHVTSFRPDLDEEDVALLTA